MKSFRFLKLRGADWTVKELIARAIKKQDYAGLINADLKSWKSLDLSEIAPQVENVMEWQGGKISIVIAKEVIFWPANGGVRNKSGFLIADFFHSASKLETAITHRNFPRYRTISIDTPCATIGSPNRNFYHRIIDSIPRVFCLWHPALLEIESITLVVDQRFSPDELELIKFLVPPNVKTIYVPYCVQVAAKNYIHLPHIHLPHIRRLLDTDYAATSVTETFAQFAARVGRVEDHLSHSKHNSTNTAMITGLGSLEIIFGQTHYLYLVLMLYMLHFKLIHKTASTLLKY